MEQQEAILEDRRNLLAHTKGTVPMSMLEMLEAIPSPLEVKQVVWMLPSDKAPGPDKLTAEVVRAGWEFIQDFMKMIEEFWILGCLPAEVKEGLIKLFPKKADKRALKDWRPLMINTTYKIIAKILALRLKKILPRLINPQKTGLIPGKNILENILVAWLTAECVTKHRMPALFLKLDFEKAFERVEHTYIWEINNAFAFSYQWLSRDHE